MDMDRKFHTHVSGLAVSQVGHRYTDRLPAAACRVGTVKNKLDALCGDRGRLVADGSWYSLDVSA